MSTWFSVSGDGDISGLPSPLFPLRQLCRLRLNRYPDGEALAG